MKLPETRFLLLCFLGLTALMLSMASAGAEPGWKTAKPGWVYEFPRDHWPHPAFKTEWWYFTGSLKEAKSGREFGFEITFFRQGVRPPEIETPKSRFAVSAFSFAHFALTDVAGKKFHFVQKASRGAYGEAGITEWTPGLNEGRITWIEDSTLDLAADGSFIVVVKGGEFTMDLRFASQKAPVFNGENGVSQKAEGEGRASHYYSLTRLAAEGSITLPGQEAKQIAVTGEAWCDREWATNALAANQLGWNWLSLQLDNGSELMLYQMRLKNGGVDPNSSGTYVAPDGTSRHLRVGDYTMTPLAFWKSKRTGGNYPIRWKMSVPSEGLEFEIETPVEGQELTAPPIAYWEGLMHAKGTHKGKPFIGHGYLEMTGYSGELKGLSETPEGAAGRH